MLTPYRQLFVPAGALRLVLTKSVARLSSATWPLALLFLVRAQTHSDALAGLALGLSGLGAACGSFASGRLIDRFGHSKVLAPESLLFVCGLVWLALLPSSSPHYLWPLLAFLVAFFEPPFGSSMRMIWSEMHDGDEAKHAAAFETIATEALWVVGPLLVGLSLALYDARAAILISAAAVLIGAGGYVSAAPVRRWRGARAHAVSSPFSERRLWRVFLVVALFLAGYDLSVVGLPSLMARHGSPHLAAVEVAIISLGTIVGGLFYGARLVTTAHRRHDIAVSLLCYGSCLALLAVAPGVWGVSVVAFLAGFSGNAVLTLCYLWAAGLAPAGATAQTYTATYAALVLGGALGGVGGGLLVARFGSSWPFLVAGLLHLLAAAVAFGARPDEGMELSAEASERLLA